MGLYRILIVADSEMLHTMYRFGLGRYVEAGIRLMKSYDGEDAWERCLLDPSPDLIILDMVRPLPGGIEFLQKRQLDTEIARIPVIVVTNKVLPEGLAPGLFGTPSGTISRPIQSDLFYQMIDRLTADRERPCNPLADTQAG